MLARHHLIWLSDQGWQRVRQAAPESQRPVIDAWRRAQWPGVVRRDDVDIEQGQVCFGIALPPDPVDGHKQRLALRASIADVQAIRTPPSIEAIIPAAPPAWRAPLARLDADAMRLKLTIRVYGSVALQALTGQSCTTATSDIDLLFLPATLAQLHVGMNLLRSHATGLPLDGEIVFPSGQAVAWKEWPGEATEPTNARVLVKEKNAVHLSTIAELLRTLKDVPCAS